MKRIIALAVIFVFAAIHQSFAEVSVKAEVDKTKLSIGQVLTYKVTIISPSERMQQPIFPSFAEFAILSQMQNSQISFSRDAQKIVSMYVFVISPAKSGIFKINPTQVKINGRTYSSQAFSIEVEEGEIPPSSKSEPSKPSGAPQQKEQEQITL